MADRKAVFNGVKLMIDWKNPKSEYREDLHFFFYFDACGLKAKSEW
jgi:hypothetical protein